MTKGLQIFVGLIVIIMTLFVDGCTRQNAIPNQINSDFLAESWMQNMHANPNLWAAHVDPWFHTGEPAEITHYAMNKPMNRAMTDITVRVPDFTNIVIQGNFQVQIIGMQEHNSVSILGPNIAAREVAVDVNNNTIFIHQIQNPTTRCEHVIVRIGMSNLKQLIQHGNGTVVGRGIHSSNLSIKATGGGNILLSGYMNVSRILACDRSTVSILGAYAPCVKLRTEGLGSINIAGRVGIQDITNYSAGHITIVGADSDNLRINAAGSGTTRIMGRVNLRSILARQHSHVLIYCVLSRHVYVKACDHAYVGLSGRVDVLAADTYDCAQLAAKTLCANIGYVQTHNESHANVMIRERLFAKSLNSSSIYYLGSPSVASRFNSGNSIILPIWSTDVPSPTFPYHENTIWSFKQQPLSGAYTTPYGNGQ